jgi:hypothetical protein
VPSARPWRQLGGGSREDCRHNVQARNTEPGFHVDHILEPLAFGRTPKVPRFEGDRRSDPRARLTGKQPTYLKDLIDLQQQYLHGRLR